MAKIRDIWLALGSNSPGPLNAARSLFKHTRNELARQHLTTFAQSTLISTPPMGPVRQLRYHNAVIGVRGSISPAALLRLVKRLERGAGRRPGVRWGPRTLDIDIIDFGGRVIGHPARETSPGRLILPHPGIQNRGFVLVPLAEAAPDWRHPILRLSAKALLARQPWLRRGIVALATATASPMPT